MNRLRTLTIGLLLVTTAVIAQDTSKILGDWGGALEAGAMKLRVAVHFTRDDDGTIRGTFDSLDQNAMGIPFDKVAFDGKTLRAEITPITASYDATINEAGDTLTGRWTQHGGSAPLQLVRVANAADLLPKRPQEPKPPLPYTSRDVTYPNSDVTLAGTLTIPEGAGPHAAVLLITGSGPQDRDETAMGHKPFLVLADYLTRHGIAVLRVDDRGVGKSTGSFEDATTVEFASDVEAGLAFLKAQKEIDAKRIGLLGHSEGGITAPIVAARSKDVSFLVLMAGVGTPMDQLMRAQSRLLLKAEGVGDITITQNDALLSKMYAISKAESDPVTREAKLREVTKEFIAMLPLGEYSLGEDGKAGIESGVRMLSTPWMHYLLNYDPTATLRRVKVPVLAINGELDLQVPADDNLAAIQKALTEGGNKDVTVKKLPKLNHLFQTATKGTISEYSTIEETMSPVALSLVSDWIVAHTQRAKK